MAQRPQHAAGEAARATELALPENLVKYAELRDRTD